MKTGRTNRSTGAADRAVSVSQFFGGGPVTSGVNTDPARDQRGDPIALFIRVFTRRFVSLVVECFRHAGFACVSLGVW